MTKPGMYGSWGEFVRKFLGPGLVILTFWVLMIFVAAALLQTGGCGSPFGGRSPPVFAPPEPGTSTPAGPTSGPSLIPLLGWLSGVLMVLGVGGLLSSFVIPIIPRTASGGCIAMSIGCMFLGRLLLRLGDWPMWILLAVAAAAGAWWLRATWGRWNLDRLGKRLMPDHPDAAVALRATARGLTSNKPAVKAKRKAMTPDRAVHHA